MKKETIKKLLKLLYKLDDEFLEENTPKNEQEKQLLITVMKEAHELKDSLHIINNIR